MLGWRLQSSIWHLSISKDWALPYVYRTVKRNMVDPIIHDRCFTFYDW